MKNLFLLLFSLWLLSATAAQAKTTAYALTIARQSVNITGHAVNKITINSTIPGPTLRFTEGDEAVIHVTNKMDVPTSVHWHGLFLPASMDGAPAFNGFDGIPPHGTFTYRFKIRQSGTYWYHAHTMGQEQDGLYGSLVITPSGKDSLHVDRDYVVLLSDFTDTESDDILANLKKDSSYYNTARRTLNDFTHDVGVKGFGKAWQDSLDWGAMRMSPTDLADVSGYTFLVNGKTPTQNWTGLFEKGERVRLRFINASAMSIYDVRIPGLKMTVVQADGQNVEPVPVDEFRIGTAETYDVIVTPQDDKAYTIAAEPIDRTGFALATLAPHDGMRGPLPKQRTRALLTMGDMGGMDMGDMTMTPADMKSGWADADTPKGHKALRYADLRYAGTQQDLREPDRTIDIHLDGNMERYIWTMNGKKFEDSTPLVLYYGERVRLTFINDTMMAHPIHLHGMFVQLENGQPAAKRPNKHTFIVPPARSVSVLLTANEIGDWPLHCHLLFHMAAGMMMKVSVVPTVPAASPKGDEIHAH